MTETRAESIPELPSEDKFYKIRDFLQRTGFDDYSASHIKQLAEEVNPEFSGVLKIDKQITPGGKSCFVITIDEKFFPVLYGGGYALPESEPYCVFISSGFSPDATSAILAHEFYHIDHADWAIRACKKHPSLQPLYYTAHELETYLASNGKNIANSARMLREYLPKISGEIKMIISQYSRKIRAVFENLTRRNRS